MLVNSIRAYRAAQQTDYAFRCDFDPAVKLPSRRLHSLRYLAFTCALRVEDLMRWARRR